MDEKQPTEWETLEPEVWKPEKEGDMIEGTLLNKEEKVGVNESNVYHVVNNNGTHMVWGTTVLDSRMRLTEKGDYVRITYNGLQKNKKGQDTKMFKVEKKRPFDPDSQITELVDEIREKGVV